MAASQLAEIAPRAANVRLRGRALVLRPLSLAQLGGLVARHEGLAAIFGGESVHGAIMAAGLPAAHEAIALSAGLPVSEISALKPRPAQVARALMEILAMTLPEQAPCAERKPEAPAPRAAGGDTWGMLAARLARLGPPDPLRYSPRQAVAWLEAGEQARKLELKEILSTVRVAAHGDKMAVRKFMEQK